MVMFHNKMYPLFFKWDYDDLFDFCTNKIIYLILHIKNSQLTTVAKKLKVKVFYHWTYSLLNWMHLLQRIKNASRTFKSKNFILPCRPSSCSVYHLLVEGKYTIFQTFFQLGRDRIYWDGVRSREKGGCSSNSNITFN